MEIEYIFVWIDGNKTPITKKFADLHGIEDGDVFEGDQAKELMKAQLKELISLCELLKDTGTREKKN